MVVAVAMHAVTLPVEFDASSVRPVVPYAARPLTGVETAMVTA
jgi:Zn-dependent membrane protease YugP